MPGDDLQEAKRVAAVSAHIYLVCALAVKYTPDVGLIHVGVLHTDTPGLERSCEGWLTRSRGYIFTNTSGDPCIVVATHISYLVAPVDRLKHDETHD